MGIIGTTICSEHADCCNGFGFLNDSFINQTYALTHWYCYRDGHPPNWTNTTNISGVIFDAPIDLGFNLTEEASKNAKAADLIEEWKHLYVDRGYLLVQISSSISIVAITIALASYLLMVFYQPLLTKKLTSRLWLAMIISDLIYSCSQLYKPAEDNWQCTTSASLKVWSKLSSIFFSSVIGINLVRMTVFEVKNTLLITILYFALPIILSIALIAKPLASGFFGFWNYSCFFKAVITKTVKLNFEIDTYVSMQKTQDVSVVWTFFNAWLFVGIGLSSLSLILFYSKLWNRMKMQAKYQARLAYTEPAHYLAADMENKSKFEVTKEKEIYQKTALRISMFLFVPIVCCLPWAILNASTNLVDILEFYYFVTFMTPLEGLFNSLIFYLDPSVLFCCEMFRDNLSKKYVLKYHSRDNSGKISKDPVFTQKGLSIKWEKRVLFGVRTSLPGRISWPIASYYFIKPIFSRKRDFELKHSGNKKEVYQNSTAVETNPIKTVKMSTTSEETSSPMPTEYHPIESVPAQSIERETNFSEEYEALKNLDI